MTTIRTRSTAKPQGWLKPFNNNGSISIRFQLDSNTYKFNPVKKGKFDNVSDYRQALQVCEQIEWDIRRSQFDSTLEKYKTKIGAVEPLSIAPKLTLGKLWEDYKTDKELIVQKTTKKSTWKTVDNVLANCNLLDCEDLNAVRSAVLTKYSVSSARTVIEFIVAAINHAIKKGFCPGRKLTRHSGLFRQSYA